MTTTIKVSNFDFTPLFSYEKALNSLTPISQDVFTGDLKISDTELSLCIKDPLAQATVSIPCTIEAQEYVEPKHIKLEYQKLLYVVKSYPEDIRAQVQLIFQHNTTTEETTLTLLTASDNLKIPHRLTTSVQPYITTTTTDIWNTCLSDTTAFIKGLSTCLQFLSSDEKKHNAIAVFPDRLVVNDRRHIVVVNNVQNTCPLSAKGYLPIYKKIARLITLVPDIESIRVDDSLSDFIITAASATFFAKNTPANIAPPTKQQLEQLVPSVKALTIDKAQLISSVDFFKGFYTSTGEWNPLTIESDGTTCKLVLKNSGSGFNSYAVERHLQCTDLDSQPIDVTIINDSLKLFLSKVTSDVLSVYIDATSPAICILSDDLDAYLVKLV